MRIPAAELSHAAIPVPADYKYDESVFDEIRKAETKFASHVYKAVHGNRGCMATSDGARNPGQGGLGIKRRVLAWSSI
ncbi:MAG: hypothetical protein R2688_01175 [Fimbriimonadaceae bacterium]